jgi:hypothetical protein
MPFLHLSLRIWRDQQIFRVELKLHGVAVD